MKTRIGQLFAVMVLAAAVGMPTMQAQTRRSPAKAKAPSTFTGCLQGDFGSGFLLSTPTGPANSTHAQMRTYKVVASGRNINLGAMANKMVEVTGTLSTSKASTGQVHTVPGSVTGVGGAGGKADLDYASGTLTAASVRQVRGSCEHDATKPSK